MFLVYPLNSRVFQLIFFTFAPYISLTKAWMPVSFWHTAVRFLATIGPSSFFLSVLYTLKFSMELFKIHTKCSLGHDLVPSTLLPPIIVCGHKGINFIFTCLLAGQGRGFEGCSLNSHHLWPLGSHLHFSLHVLYRAEFSKNLLQIHTKYSSDQNLDS